jgi:hypothetical protein
VNGGLKLGLAVVNGGRKVVLKVGLNGGLKVVLVVVVKGGRYVVGKKGRLVVKGGLEVVVKGGREVIKGGRGVVVVNSGRDVVVVNGGRDVVVVNVGRGGAKVGRGRGLYWGSSGLVMNGGLGVVRAGQGTSDTSTKNPLPWLSPSVAKTISTLRSPGLTTCKAAVPLLLPHNRSSITCKKTNIFKVIVHDWNKTSCPTCR